ncbi:MAG: phosphopyruvate hydratase, partial [Erysipelotrichaceae bacterium]|nr:phosphopyruvate hydratase [Erysipelotrichaceae bacterium]
YIEDGFADTDYKGWQLFMKNVNVNNIMISGDDLFATNIKRLNQYKGLANMAVVKPNQIGTVSETIDFIIEAEKKGVDMLVSQRTGETDDVIITHLAYAFGLLYLKAGGIQRMDRVAKFNELIRLEEWMKNYEK